MSSADFGELVLVLGDLHIPHRSVAIPEKFKRMLVPNKMHHVICTGNLISKDQYDELRNLAPPSGLHVVRGDFDDNGERFPEHKVITVGEFKIGILHGHKVVPWGDLSALSMVQRQLDVDILITGHTHKCSINKYEGKWFINPGSITGAYSTVSPDAHPSFMLLAIKGSKVVAFTYELKNGEENNIDITKQDLTK